MTAPIVIAGTGSIGQRHLRNLVAIGGPPPILYSSGLGMLPLPPGFPVERRIDSALQHAPCAVIVANPTSHHLTTALEAARAGAHLLIEKPISHTLDGLGTLRAEQQRHRLRILIGYQFRFHPMLRRVREWIAGGRIGRVVAAHAHGGEYLPDRRPWEDYGASYSAREDLGGGVLLTLSHPFEYLAWLFGPVQRVSARIRAAPGLELRAEGMAQVLLEFESGAVASVHLDYVQRPPANRLEILGTHGKIRWSARSGVARLISAAGPPARVRRPPPGFRRNDLFLAELRHFLDCIARGAAPGCSLADGVHALRIALAARQSAAEGRIVDL